MMSERKYVTYPKLMRANALRDGKHLCTLDVPGMCMQGPMSEAVKKAIAELALRIIKKEIK